ncbi:hypothetical protein [Aquibacillus saliphilus]|uniref:hypothetical protein n=1 Tax=Aquibacillus saliphilus TaxID=1909422 RepID=UPI001CF00362|nr:hypothetical protein [Aquibacillus saliphilus]
MAVHPLKDFLTTLKDGVSKALRVKGEVELTGSTLEKYGATITQRPDATTVPVGFIYMAVDTQEMWQSNGTSWVVV